MTALESLSIFKTRRFAPIIAFIILLTATLLLMSFKHNWNITGFFRIGDQLPVSPYLNENDLVIHKDQIGYDGQFFLTIALDPAMSDEDSVESLDFPRYRMKRILMPALAHIISFGQASLIPYSFVFLNGLLVFLAIFFLNKRIGEQSEQQLRPLLYLCIPGIWVSFSLSTVEAAACSLVILSYYFYKKEKPILTSVLILLACLTKETTILFLMGYAISAILNKNWRLVSGLAIALIPFCSWHLYISMTFTDVGQLSELGNFGIPLQGHIEKLQQLFLLKEHVNKNEYLYYFTLCIGSLYLIAKLPGLWKSQIELFIPACGYLLIFVQSSMAILTYHLGYSRVFLAIYTIILLSKSEKTNKLDKSIWIFTGLAAFRYLYWFIK